MVELYNKTLNKNLLVRRITLVVNHVIDEKQLLIKPSVNQLDLFSTEEVLDDSNKIELEREKKRQQAIIDIKKRYGKNSIFKAVDLEDGATTLSRNQQIGGHKA
jgi:hypothetical protein